jgi:deazaflavin-dependent oxidoreductase (nitroreductase family)
MTTRLPDIDPALPATDPAAMNAFNRLLIDQFRACQGTLIGQLAGAPILLLTTTGARTGRRHATPLGYVHDGKRHIVAASKAGAPANPDWYANLLANPAARVETGTEPSTPAPRSPRAQNAAGFSGCLPPNGRCNSSISRKPAARSP